MLGISEIKSGKNIVLDGSPFAVLYHEHSKTGRAGSVLRTRLRNLKTGAVLEKTFQGAEHVEEAEIAKGKAQYLYQEGDEFFFMDNESYEQFSLARETLGKMAEYLLEGTEVTLLNWNQSALNIELPVKMTFKVSETPPGVRGNTVSTGGKVATLETGIKVNVPLFVNTGDSVIINTETGEYASRA